MADLIALKAELDNDPLTRGYAGMTDQQAADDLNLVNRPGAAGTQEFVSLVYLERHSSGNGSDTVNTPIVGRIFAMRQASPNDDVFGQGNLPQQAQEAKAAEIHSSVVLFDLARGGNFGGPIPLNFRDTNLEQVLTDCVDGQVMGATNKTNIQALSDNKQTRAQELNLGEVIAGDVLAARNLP